MSATRSSLAAQLSGWMPSAFRRWVNGRFAERWISQRLSRSVREHANAIGLRKDLHFNDLRGTKVTELVWWPGGITIPELAVHMGWKLDRAAQMMGVYASLNPDFHGGGDVVAFPGGQQVAE